MKYLSLVISVYNEEESLVPFYNELSKVLSEIEKEVEVIFVNDGSCDKSFEILKSLAEKDKRLFIINFSRNFGHEAAMIAGIDYSKGKNIACLDADLQHPPHYILDMLQKMEEGSDIVNMVRIDREDGGLIKKLTSNLFYWVTNKMLKAHLEPNASDFFMISSRVADQLRNNYRERARFLRGFIQIIGFNRTSIEFKAPKRVAGESKYSLFKLISLSLQAVSTLSKVPLKIGLWFGSLFAIFSIIIAIYSLIMWIVDTPVSGYTTLVILICAMFSINFIVLGIIGEYIGFLFDEAKKRPIYVVMDEVGNDL